MHCHVGAIRKTFSVKQRRCKARIIITTDASPWGLGGFITRDGVCKGWFSEAIQTHDCQRFGIVVGDHRFQSLLENLALLVAVRLWLPVWKDGRLGVCLRSDSMAAIGAWKKERSVSPDINVIVREMSLDLAEGLYALDCFEHIPGKSNTWADVLSRQQIPGVVEPLPAVMVKSLQYTPPSRDHRWWRLGARPTLGAAVDARV